MFYSFWLTFRSLIHFEFIFVFGVRKCSNFILLHVVVQFSEHFLKKFFSPFYILASFVKDKVPTDAWVFFEVLDYGTHWNTHHITLSGISKAPSLSKIFWQVLIEYRILPNKTLFHGPAHPELQFLSVFDPKSSQLAWVRGHLSNTFT